VFENLQNKNSHPLIEKINPSIRDTLIMDNSLRDQLKRKRLDDTAPEDEHRKKYTANLEDKLESLTYRHEKERKE